MPTILTGINSIYEKCFAENTMPENIQICCICLKTSPFFQNINEHNYGDIRYINKLQVCLPNELWHEDFNMCNDCIDKLDTSYVFIQLCVQSEEYRKNELQVIEQKKEHSPTSFTCQQCNKTFRLKRTLSLHITRIHKIKNHKRRSLGNVCIKDYIKEEPPIHNGIKEAIIAPESTEDIFDENIKYEKDTHATQELDDYGGSDYDNRNTSYSSDEELLKEKKAYAGKKRGPKHKGPRKCGFCELTFTRTDRYVQHIRSKHTLEKPFKCDLCDAKYFSSHNLNVHKRKHTNEKPYVCSTCGKSFISSNDLWQHNKIHDVVRQYPCTECERSFKTHSNLRTHKLQMHQDPGMWKFVCTVCGKKFPLNNNLIKHMRRHEGIKQFSCHLCEKKFVEKIDLQTHLVSHSNERLFKCHICVKEYKKRETLRRHLKTEHDTGNYNVKKPEKKLSCPMCPRVFAFNNKLQRHILTHTGEKPVKCEFCDKRFRDNYDRNVHLRKTHNVEPNIFKCESSI